MLSQYINNSTDSYYNATAVQLTNTVKELIKHSSTTPVVGQYKFYLALVSGYIAENVGIDLSSVADPATIGSSVSAAIKYAAMKINVGDAFLPNLLFTFGLNLVNKLAQEAIVIYFPAPVEKQTNITITDMGADAHNASELHHDGAQVEAQHG
ncbi:hypothetical protein MIDIC_100005 [Alphaproteobacteria bacterium]